MVITNQGLRPRILKYTFILMAAALLNFSTHAMKIDTGSPGKNSTLYDKKKSFLTTLILAAATWQITNDNCAILASYATGLSATHTMNCLVPEDNILRFITGATAMTASSLLFNSQKIGLFATIALPYATHYAYSNLRNAFTENTTTKKNGTGASLFFNALTVLGGVATFMSPTYNEPRYLIGGALCVAGAVHGLADVSQGIGNIFSKHTERLYN